MHSFLHCSPLEEFFGALLGFFVAAPRVITESHCCTAVLEVHFVVLIMHCEGSLAIIFSEEAAVIGASTVTQRTKIN